jgi:hypothetical protein
MLRFERGGGGNGAGLFQVFPASEQFPSYSTRIIELITTLSELEQRHPVAVLEDILGSPSLSAGRDSVGQAVTA